MDRGAWRATDHGITKSWTWLSNFSCLTLCMHSFTGKMILCKTKLCTWNEINRRISLSQDFWPESQATKGCESNELLAAHRLRGFCVNKYESWSDFWTLWGKVRVGCFERTASKHVYYLGWNRSPAQVGWMRQVLRPGALGRPRGIGWRGRWEGGSGWGIRVYPWLIHVNVWQKPLKKINKIKIKKIKKKKESWWTFSTDWLPSGLFFLICSA